MAHIVKSKMGKRVNNYLDDVFFAHLLAKLCNGQVSEFVKICQYTNLPVSMEKSFWATQVLVFLDILINTIMQTISISLEKRENALEGVPFE